MTHLEHVGGPLLEALLLAVELVSAGHRSDPLAGEVAQEAVHVLAELTELGVGARAQGEHSEPAQHANVAVTTSCDAVWMGCPSFTQLVWFGLVWLG